jgi:serine/threonine-protein kinase
MVSVSTSGADPLENTPYRAIRELGRGAMGAVYEAAHRKLRRLVCVKLIHPELASEPALVDRMRLEAEALAALSHPNVVAVYDYGETADDRRPYLVTEILRGQTLQEYVREHGKLSLEATIDLGQQILSGLGAAHEVGLVHRDVKPANLFLVGDPGMWTLKILDFGVAKLTRPSEQVTALESPTAPGFMLGTPRYMAPEQIVGQSVDARADLYATALVLYHAATGQGPFDDIRDFAELCGAQITQRPAPPSSLVPDLPPAFDELILRALEKSPQRRFASASEMRAALMEIAAQTPPADTAPGGSALAERHLSWARFAGVLVLTSLLLFLVGVALARALGLG